MKTLDSRVRAGAAAVVLIVSGCTSTVPQLTSGPHVLQLAEGDVQDFFDFDAPNPSTHYFDVEVTMPASTSLDVTFLTADGATLYIFTSDPVPDSCVAEAGQLRCLLHFPILEARKAGTWTANVHKLSTGPAEITVTVSWTESG